MVKDSMEAAISEPDVEPGEVLETIRNLVMTGSEPDTRPIQTLDQQRELAEIKLDSYLENIADSEGASKVVEQFHREEHGEDIDASDPEVLKDLVPDVDSILHDRRLPVVDKEMLREKYGVEGAAGADGSGDVTKPHLMPSWVEEHDEEPIFTTTTSGTTGEPWGRPMTRNDAAVFGMNIMDFVDDVISDFDVEAKDAAVANPYMEAVIREPIGRALQAKGLQVENFDYDKIEEGGEAERETVDAIKEHLHSEEGSAIVFPIELLVEGALGVNLRRGDLGLDAVINVGAPVQEEEFFEERGIEIYDIYGETEHNDPGLKKEIEGERGWDLPFNSQLNLIYDEDSGDLSFEGTGRFAHLPFGLEGQAIPGVYLSGIRGTLTRIGDRHQLLSDIERVHDLEGCTSPDT